MKLLILALFLFCAWAQYDVNLCDPTYACTSTTNCADSPDNFPYVSDRSGWKCNTDKGTCVAPQCSHLKAFNEPDAFANQCPSGSYCDDNFVCQTYPVVPQPEPIPQPPPVNIPEKYSIADIITAAGMNGDYCQYDQDCTIGYCNTGTSKCTAKKAFSPDCPQTCTPNSNECYDGICTGDGKCSRSDYRRIVGVKCEDNTECFSLSCVNGVCSGTDCSNFECTNAGYYCDYVIDSSGIKPNCFPNYDTFACDPNTKYAYRQDNQTVVCADKKKGSVICNYNYECETNWCQYAGSSYACSSYPQSAIPEGQSCANGGICTTGLKCNSQKVCSTGAVGSSCSLTAAQGVDCNSGLICNSATDKCAKPGMEGDVCYFYTDCATGFYCNASSQCKQQVNEGGPCGSSDIYPCSQAVSTTYCLSSDGGQTYSCEQSPTLGKPCGWNDSGAHNCTTLLAETCACFAADTGSNVPRCVNVDSKAYHNQYDKYVPEPVPAQPGQSGSSSSSDASSQICLSSLFKIDPNLVSSLSQVLTVPYISSKTSGCSLTGYFPNDAKCQSLYAELYCCYICGGILDTYLAEYPDLDKDAKIFYSEFSSPIISLSCGATPSFKYDPNSCSGPELYSINDILKQLDCGNTAKPSYAQVTVTVSFPPGTDLNSASTTLKQIITSVINDKGYVQPTAITVTPNPNNPNALDVTLTYAGDQNDPSNIDDATSALSSTDFTGQVTNAVPGTTVSTPQTQTTQGSGSGMVVFSMISLISFVLIGLLF